MIGDRDQFTPADDLSAYAAAAGRTVRGDRGQRPLLRVQGSKVGAMLPIHFSEAE